MKFYHYNCLEDCFGGIYEESNVFNAALFDDYFHIMRRG
jgi:hypothetical protein